MFSEVKLSQMKHDKNFCDVKLPRITINEENSSANFPTFEGPEKFMNINKSSKLKLETVLQ